MKKRLGFFSFVTAVALVAIVSWGNPLRAQTNRQQPSTQTQQPPDTQAPPDQSQTPQDQAQPSDPAGAKEFVGTVVKQGDKYMFQDSASGSTYDIDHQDEVKRFEGKRVRVRGTLDANAKMIHVQ